MSSQSEMAVAAMVNEEQKRPRRLRQIWVLAGGCLAIGAVVGLLASNLVGGDEEGAAVVPTKKSRSIQLNEGLIKRAGIRIDKVKKQPFSPILDLPGSVNFDMTRVADVGGRISGRITRAMVVPGQKVKKGDALVEIEGADLGGALSSLLSAKANLAAARAQATREENLAREQLTTGAALEQARAHAKALEAEVKGAEQHLLAMGVSPSSVGGMSEGRTGPRRIVLRSPIAGEVIELHAVLGQVVDPTHPVLRVADLGVLWIQLDVFEVDLARVHQGDKVKIITEAYPDRIFSGTVDHIESYIDEQTRTARVRIIVDNTDRLLRPGQFIHAQLSPKSTEGSSIVIPRRAVVQIDGEPTAFVQTGARRFEPRPLQLGSQSESEVEVAHGLLENDRLVVEGAFALKSEMLR